MAKRLRRASDIVATAWLFAGLQPAVSLAGTYAAAGDVGRTSYVTLPFQTEVYRDCWQCSPDLEPAELFYEANPASPYFSPARMRRVRAAAAGLDAIGVVPSAGAQRWQGTFAASFPRQYLADEPADIGKDRALHRYDTRPEFVAWRNFIVSHPDYADVAFDGGTMPNRRDYRDWHGQWGFISPLTPLDPADCPPDMKQGCNWGDAYAYRWARTSALTGSYGLMLSDFSDSQPLRDTLHDYNPRIVDRFATRYSLQSELHGLGTAAASAWITAHRFNNWTDFLDEGYAAFFAALAGRIGIATSHAALIADQCSSTPADGRLVGVDARAIARITGSRVYTCIWDDHVMQRDRRGPVVEPIMRELAGFVVAAAREPAIRNGANLEADSPAFRLAIDRFYPGLNTADRQLVGQRLLKRLWVWSCWAHISDRGGHVRRAIAFASRDYGDRGTLTGLEPLATLLHTIVPAAPFGTALYYSVAGERSVERSEQDSAVGRSLQTYLQPGALQALIDTGGNFGYYVSDAALPNIALAAGNVPSAWVVAGGRAAIPPIEYKRLQALAPVVASAAELARLPGQPFVLSGGLVGFAFRDQDRRLIVVAANPSASPTAVAITGTATIAGLCARGGLVTDLFAGTRTAVAATHGTLVLPLTLQRWDTQALAVTCR